jgi:polyisoprenoid-binding protein YceI
MTGIASPCLPAQFAESPPPSPLQIYRLDPDETRSRFETKFMGFITVRGKFNRTTGILLRDPLQRHSSIHAIIDTTTLHAMVVNAAATNHVLRGADFFHVDKYPTIEFSSSQFVYEGEKLLRIDGALTLLGTSRPVTLIVSASQCLPAESERRARCEASAAVTVKRSEFGMLAWNESVADEVKIIVDLVAVETLPDILPVRMAPDATTAKLP